jgi:predicted thioesterase
LDWLQCLHQAQRHLRAGKNVVGGRVKLRHVWASLTSKVGKALAELGDWHVAGGVSYDE